MDSPSDARKFAINTADSSPASSYPLNTSASGYGPKKNDSSTSTGATNRAICALDPIATARIEELIHELKGRYAIAIVTHNMQQAARVSQRTAFFHLGRLVEYGETPEIFTNPREQRTRDYITGRYG